MPLTNRSTLTQFLIEERRRFPAASGDFNALILDVALACKAISRAVAFGELGGAQRVVGVVRTLVHRAANRQEFRFGNDPPREAVPGTSSSPPTESGSP